MNYEDRFNFTVYLECDQGSNNSCDTYEWFEDWDYDTESTDGDNLDDTINIVYNPDTDCDCEIGAFVYLLSIFLPLIPSGSFFSDFNITFFFINLSLLYAVNKKTNIFYVEKKN